MTGLDRGWEADWLTAVGEDPEFRLISRWTRVSLRLIGENFDRTYRIDHSTIAVDDERAPAHTVTLTGSSDAWTSYLSPVPRPPNHHILAMQRRRNDFSIDGRHALIQHLRVLNRVLDLMRTASASRERELT